MHSNKKKVLSKNLLQKNSYYKMKKNLTFLECNEKRCKRNLFFHNLDILKTLNIYILINNFLEFIDFKNNKIISNILRIPLLILNIYNILFISKIDKILYNKFFIRILIFITDKVNFVIFCKQNKTSKIDFFSLKIFNSIFTTTIFLNYIFVLDVNESIYFYLIDSVILLSFHGHRKNFFITRFYKNFFSYNLIYTLYFLFVCFSLQFIYEKSLRKLWALNDSYKKSYYMIKQIFDEIQFGVIIVSKDLKTIFYKNSTVNKFYMRGNYKNSKKNKEITFKEILNLDNPQLENLFVSELNKANFLGINSFIFPLTNKFVYKENNYHQTLYKINKNENKNFMKINVYSSFWKNKIECYFIILNTNLFNLNNSLQSFERFKQINKETQVFLDNLSYICYKLTRNNNEISKKKTIKIKGKKTDSISKINKSPSFDFEKKNDNYFKKMTDLFFNKNKNNMSNIDTNFDYSFLFYIKYSYNYIYDLTLTDYVLNSLVENKYINENKFFNFDNFLHYLFSYLTTFAKAKNFNIEIKNILTENIYANYIYIRVLIFNIFFFIINNTNSSKEKKNEKTLEIKVEHVFFAPKGNYYGISFIFPDDYHKISYKILSKFFSVFDMIKFKNLNLNDFDKIDYRLLVAFLISNTIFDINDKNLKNFYIEADNEKKILIYASIYIPEKKNENLENKFLNFNYNFYTQNDLLNKINEKIIEIQSQNSDDEIDIFEYNEEKEKSNVNYQYEIGKKDIFNKNLENYTLDEDQKLAFNVNFNKVLFQQNKNINEEVNIENLIVKNMSCKLDNKKHLKKKENFKFELKKNIKFSSIPRLLIFESKSKEIVENLKEIKLKILYEIVDDGKIGSKKFKDFIKIGFMFDFVFFDYDLLKTLENEFLNKIREIESKFNVHTKFVCFIDKNVYDVNEIQKKYENLIDDYFEKPINKQKLKDLFLTHLKDDRKEKNINIFFKT